MEKDGEEYFRDCLPFYEPMTGGPVVIAHRGGTDGQTFMGGGDAGGNTLSAIQRSNDLGIEYCEIDVISTRDGVPMLFHGWANTPQKIHNKSETPTRRNFRKMSRSEIREIKTHSGEPIPTFQEAITAFPNMKFLLDVKDDESLTGIAEILKKENADARICMSAVYSHRRNQRFYEIMSAQNRQFAMTIGLIGSIPVCMSALAGWRPKKIREKLKLSNEETYTRAKLRAKESNINGWGAYPRLTKGMVDFLHNEFRLPVIAGTDTFSREPLTEEKVLEQLTKGIDGIMVDNVQIGLDAMRRYNAGERFENHIVKVY